MMELIDEAGNTIIVANDSDNSETCIIDGKPYSLTDVLKDTDLKMKFNEQVKNTQKED